MRRTDEAAVKEALVAKRARNTGQFDTLEATLDFYARVSDLERAGQLRNGAPELANIALTAMDQAAVAAFRRSLNEDYE